MTNEKDLNHAIRLITLLRDTEPSELESMAEEQGIPWTHFKHRYTGYKRHQKYRDFIDYIEVVVLGDHPAGRRRGLSSFQPDAINKFSPTPDLQQVIDITSKLSANDTRLVIIVARALLHALKPRKVSSGGAARGTFETSVRTSKRPDNDATELKRIPVLNWRIWVTGGGDFRNQRSVKKVYYYYLTPLADLFNETPPSQPTQAHPPSKERRELSDFLKDCREADILDELNQTMRKWYNLCYTLNRQSYPTLVDDMGVQMRAAFSSHDMKQVKHFQYDIMQQVRTWRDLREELQSKA